MRGFVKDGRHLINVEKAYDTISHVSPCLWAWVDEEGCCAIFFAMNSNR